MSTHQHLIPELHTTTEELSDEHGRRESSNIISQDLDARTFGRGFQQDLSKILPEGSVKYPRRGSHKIGIKGAAAGEDLTRSRYKSVPRASQKSLHTSTSGTWHLQDLYAATSQRGSYQDLQKIF